MYGIRILPLSIRCSVFSQNSVEFPKQSVWAAKSCVTTLYSSQPRQVGEDESTEELRGARRRGNARVFWFVWDVVRSRTRRCFRFLRRWVARAKRGRASTLSIWELYSDGLAGIGEKIVFNRREACLQSLGLHSVRRFARASLVALTTLRRATVVVLCVAQAYI